MEIAIFVTMYEHRRCAKEFLQIGEGERVSSSLSVLNFVSICHCLAALSTGGAKEVSSSCDVM